MRHKAHHRHRTATKQLLVWAIIAALTLLVGAAVFFRAPSTHSVEVTFTDDAAHGMQIVPASCASPPPTAPSNSAGYDLNNGASNDQVSTQDYNFCVSNSSGNNYFVPHNSVNELRRFYDAALDSDVSGVTIQSQDGVSAPPTADLTVNGVHSVSVNVGDTVTYVWSSTAGASYQATFTTDTPACGQATTGPFSWSPYGTTASGSYSSQTVACESGHTYYVFYVVTGADGNTTASSLATVHIN